MYNFAVSDRLAEPNHGHYFLGASELPALG